MEYQDYYARLGVPPDADPETIKRAYRSMARRYHPDINRDDPNAERVLKEINEAYAVLSDPEKRRLYDRFGAAWQQAQRRGVNFDWTEWFTTGGVNETRRSRPTKRPEAKQTNETPKDANADGSAFSDFFQALFGGGGGRGSRRTRVNRRRARQKTEQVLPVEITLEEAFWGTTRTIQLGDVRYQVTIPQGVDTGSKVHIPLRQGQSENLYLLVRVQEHEHFRRVKSDLYMQALVDLYTMLLGGQVEIPTLQGPLALTIPPNTQNGRVFRLAGQGMPDMHQPQRRGDLYVEAVAELPVPLNDEERARYLALQRLRQRGRSR